MITRIELNEAFAAIGARVVLAPAGLDFRVAPDQPGARVTLRTDAQGEYFEVTVNYTRVVDMWVTDVNEDRRQLVLVANDWGRTLDASPLVFFVGINEAGWFVNDLTEKSEVE